MRKGVEGDDDEGDDDEDEDEDENEKDEKRRSETGSPGSYGYDGATSADAWVSGSSITTIWLSLPHNRITLLAQPSFPRSRVAAKRWVSSWST